MPEWKTDDYLPEKGLARLAKLRWWFIALIILGITGVVLGVMWQAPEVTKNLRYLQQSDHLLNWIANPALAQAPTGAAPERFDPRPIIVLGVFLVLAVVLLMAIYKMLFSDDENQVGTAGDIAKTLLGFFVGVGTSYFGL
jgi:hypothetical protein